MFACLLATGVDLALYCNGSRNFKLQHLQAAFSVSGFYGENNMTANGPRRCMIFQVTSFIPTCGRRGTYSIALRFCRQILVLMPLRNNLERD